MTWLDNFWTKAKQDEAWVIAEFQKGAAALASAEQTLAVDVLGIFKYIADHQAQIQSAVTVALKGATIAGAFVPAVAPYVPATLAALDASQVLIDQLGKAAIDGSTPLSTLVTAFQATKDAATAAAPLLKAAVTVPAPAA